MIYLTPPPVISTTILGQKIDIFIEEDESLLLELIASFCKQPVNREKVYDISVSMEALHGHYSKETNYTKWKYKWKLQKGVFYFRHEGGIIGTCEIRECKIKGSFKVVPQPMIISHLLEFLLSQLLPYKRGIIIHATSIISSNKGVAFPAAEDSGKTALAKLLGRSGMVRVVDEDKSIFWMVSDQEPILQAYPLLQDGVIEGQEEKFPLSFIVFPEGGDDNRLVRLDETSAARRLLGNAIILMPDKKTMESLLDTAISLVEKIPCFTLTFRNDESISQLLADELGLNLVE